MTHYFPLRRANGESQYILGRTFLEEAYVIADYERMNFTVLQAVLSSENKSQSVVIISDNALHTLKLLPAARQARSFKRDRLAASFSEHSQ